jgi:ABC-2 type transport system permease protein
MSGTDSRPVRSKRPMRRPLQVGAFMRKEILDVLRQPRLLLTLVLGPFLIMAAFGIGYDDSPERMRTVFVASSEDHVMIQQVRDYEDRLGDFVDVRGVSTDERAVRRLLADGDIDLMVIFPDDPMTTVLGGDRAEIEVVHTRLDPIQRAAIMFASDLAVGEINGAILSRIVGEGQSSADGALDEMQGVLEQMRAAAVSATESERVERLGELTAAVTSSVDRITSADPAIVTQPFTSEVGIQIDRVPDVTDWYAPAAVILMLQQFGVAFGALTFVRERQLGIVDVFRVAPVGATEALLGKYLAYLALGLAVGAALTALVVFAIGTPLAGSIWAVVAIMVLSLVASIGLGFVISLASGSDAQAVQYTMITLLASLFFSGFFLAVGQMEGVAKVISWLLPVTYGMAMLRDVMLRGSGLDPLLVGGLVAYSAVAFVLALLGTRRRIGTG